jgi:cysteine-rich repeat protein
MDNTTRLESKRDGGLTPIGVVAPLFLWVFLLAGPTRDVGAVDYSGTVSFQGNVVFAVPIPGIDAEDVQIGLKGSTEATGSGEKCSIDPNSISIDNPDPNGAYPSLGTVSADFLLERGGSKIPEGECIVTLQANGTDGVSVSARGYQILFVTADQINTSATVSVPDITVRESKAIAELDKECFKWVKKQLRFLAKCNFLLLKKGPEAAEKCRDAGPEPPDCDPGNHVDAILALSHGVNNQHADPNNALSVSLDLMKRQIICQKLFGKAAANYAIKRSKLVDRKCAGENADPTVDPEDCREDQGKDSKRKLDVIDKCDVPQTTDPNNGRRAPDVGPPCDVCIADVEDPPGEWQIDRKCLKGCFEMVLNELSDGIVGDLPVCGNSILQPPEVCDDGNLANGDCCSDICWAEDLGNQTCGVGACEVTVPVCQGGAPLTCVPGTPGTEGPLGDPSCSDGIDNDCDTTTDGADTDCQ